MKREFLQNFKVGDQPLSKEVIDAIMEENGRDIEAAKKALYTGNYGDGKIFVYNVETVVKVRTGETNYDALQGD